MSLLGTALAGPAMLTCKSVCVSIVVLASFASLLELESKLSLVAAAVLSSEPAATFGLTLTTSIKSVVAPAASEVKELVIVPAAPTLGIVDAQPFGAVNEMNVVPVGRTSFNLIF